MSSTLMQASHQWSSRPDDERYLSIPDMVSHFAARRYLRSTVEPETTI